MKRSEPIKRLIDRQTVFMAPTATLREIAERLWWQAVGVVVVGTADDPHGIVSERDLVALLATNADTKTTAEQAMTRPLVSVREDDPISQAGSVMIEHAIRHLPVTDDHGRVLGVVSIRDVMGALLAEARGDGARR